MTENAAGIGTVTRQMVRDRAGELALIDGRRAEDVSKSETERAKRELTGEPEIDPNDALLEAAPESERWDPLPGSTGEKAGWLPARMRTRKDAAIMRGWCKKALPGLNMIKCVKPRETGGIRSSGQSSAFD